MDTNLKSYCENLVDKTLKAGADSCDVILSKGESLSLSAQERDLDKYKVSGSQVIGVRAIKDSKVGISYTESLDEDSLNYTAKSAVENAQNSEVNDYETISVSDKEHVYPTQFKEESATTEDKISFALKLESDVLDRDSKVKSAPYNSLSEVKSSMYILNSKNTFGFKSDYYLSCMTSAFMETDKQSSMFYEGAVGRTLEELKYKNIIDVCVDHAGNFLEAKALKTGHYDVIFSPDKFQEIFSCFSNIFSAKGAMEKTNPFSEKIGKKIANSSFTLQDLPQYKDAFSKYYFDSEGLKREDLTLIENGELKSFYHNSVTANFFKTKNTGHGSRGAKSALGVSGTNKVISGGTLSDTDLHQGEYFEVHYIQGLYSGANAVSGEFSFAASGYLCKDGKRVMPVKGVTLSGNFHDLLFNVQMIGKDIVPTNSKDFFSPKMRFEKMSLAGS